MSHIIEFKIVCENEPNRDIIKYIYEYLDGVFPSNKGISHEIREYTNYAEILKFLRKIMNDKE